MALKRFPAIDAHISRRQGIGQQSSSLLEREARDDFPGLTRQFGQYCSIMYGNGTGNWHA